VPWHRWCAKHNYSWGLPTDTICDNWDPGNKEEACIKQAVVTVAISSFDNGFKSPPPLTKKERKEIREWMKT
jgi:hypothetical protein